MIFRLIVAFLLAAASAHATSGSGDMLTPTDCRQRLDDGWVAIDHSRVAESYALLQPCLAVARQGEPEPWKVEIRIALAVGALGAGDYRRGLELAREAVAQTTRLDDRALRIEALNTEADMHFYLGDLESALATFERAAALHETGDDPVSQAITLKNIGVTENNMGRPERALWSLKRARELAPEDEPAHELWISILGNLGAVYERLGAAELALGAYQEALEHVELRENPEERVDILLRLGRLYLDQGLVTQAVATLEQGQALAAVHSAVPNRAWLASILADAYQLAGRLDEARELMVENVRLRRLAGSPPHMAVDLIDLGSLEQEASPRRAEALFAEALAWVDGRLPQLASWALAKQAELRLAAGETEQAVALAQRAVTTLEGVYSAPEAVAGGLPRHGVYPTALAALLERGSPADYRQAFAYAEQALSKAMLRRLMLERLTIDPLAGETGETLAGEPLDPELERKRRALEERLQRLQQQLDPNAETAPETLDLLAEARAEHEALIRLIRQHSPHFAALRYPVPLTVDQARDLLDERTALVTYVPLLGDELAVFVLDLQTLEVVRLPAERRELASRTRTMRLNDKRYTLSSHFKRAGIVSRHAYRAILRLLRVGKNVTRGLAETSHSESCQAK
ncbi:MAG: tetratricopeptide repeat protein [Acidobacteriota bacterium]